jgi:hypothetical protein
MMLSKLGRQLCCTHHFQELRRRDQGGDRDPQPPGPSTREPTGNPPEARMKSVPAPQVEGGMSLAAA